MASSICRVEAGEIRPREHPDLDETHFSHRLGRLAEGSGGGRGPAEKPASLPFLVWGHLGTATHPLVLMEHSTPWVSTPHTCVPRMLTYCSRVMPGAPEKQLCPRLCGWSCGVSVPKTPINSVLCEAELVRKVLMRRVSS